MTLGEFFSWLAQHPVYLIFFFALCPVAALLAWWLGKGEGHFSPWKYFYSVLAYAICIPGIFAVTLNVYVFLFERRSIFETDIWTQILPVISMVATLILVRRNVSFDKIPGFGKLNGMVLMIGSVLIFMWLIDRTRILAISYIPFYQVVIGFAVLLLMVIVGWRWFTR